MTASGHTDPTRRPLPLGWLVVVLAAHLLLLAWPLPAPSVSTTTPPPPAVMQTRQVVLPTPAPAAPVTAKPPPAQRPAPRPTPAPTTAPPVPAPTPATEAVAAAASPVPAEETPPPPPPPPAAEPPAAPAAETPVAEAPEPPAPPPPPEAPPLQLPPTTQLSYAVTATRGGALYEATGVMNWQLDGNRYGLKLVWRAFFFSREQSSTGRVDPDGLHPERFAERTRSERAAHFDEAGGRVRFSANTPDAVLKPGTQDRLSLFMQLAGRFNAQPQAFPPGTSVRLPVVGSRDLEEWTLTVEGSETLELPVGPTPSVKLQRLPRREFDQKVEIWLAPSLGHLPVRIRVTEANGDVADQRLSGR